MSTNRASVTMERGLAVLVFIGAVLLAGIAMAARQQTLRLEDAARWAQQSRAAVLAVEAVSRATLDAEAAQRGVLLGVASAPERYRAAVAETRASLQRAQEAIDADSQQLARLARMRTAAEASVEAMDRAVDAASRKPEFALAVVRDANANRWRDEIRDDGAAIIALEGERFDERIAAARAARRATIVVGAFTLILLLLVTTGAVVLLARELRLRALVTAHLRASQDDLRKSELFLDRTSKMAGIGGWEADLVEGDVVWSEQTRRIHGVAADHRPGLERMVDFFAPEARPAFRAALQAAMTEGGAWDMELPFVRADGERIWVRAVGSAEFVEGVPVRLVGALQDISDRVNQRLELDKLASDLDEDRSLLKVTLESIGDALITTDIRGAITWLNPVAERMTGWTSADAIGRPLAQVFHVLHEETRKPAPEHVLACLEQGRPVGIASQLLLLSRHGEEFGIQDSAAPIRNEAGDVLGVVLVFRDVSEQRRLSSEMSFRASHDTLTGLLNRTEFELRLGRLLDKAREGGSEHALLYIDLDQFKLVNDACGHTIGDQLLQQVARLLAEAVRGSDTLARLGGDEFGILMEHCTADQAQRVAQKICDRMDDFRFLHEERRFRIGTSIGLVPVDRRWQTIAAIQQAADTSCYAAKEAGRNRVHAWFDTDIAMRERQFEMQWTTRIEQALDDDGFVLFAQRIEPLKGRVAGLHAEVLLRMTQPGGAIVAPGAFLPAAERFHLASRIDRWVLRRVVDWMTALQEPARIELLSVNLSGQSVGDRSFHRWALELLEKAGPRLCGALCLEITETAAVTNIADAVIFIDQVRACGVKVALDDFGAGAASFGYLKTLTVDILKIDGQFVRDLVDDPLDEVAVRCFADVAQVMGLTTVAEFVDKPAVLHKLGIMGVDFAQGYLLHLPEPIDELIEPAVAGV